MPSRREPQPALAEIDGFGGVNLPAVGQQAKADHADTHSQRPLAQAGPVAHVDNVTDRTHGTEMRFLRNGTKEN